MTSAILDFKAIAAATSPVKVMEGPALILEDASRSKRRSVQFNADLPPEYPAIFYYDPITDEPWWVECSDPFAIHVANRKNDAALALVAGIPAPIPLLTLVQGWANRLWLKLSECDIKCIRTEPFQDGARMGQVVPIDGFVCNTSQMHVDWMGEVSDMAPIINALASAIVQKIAPKKELHSYQLWVPNGGAEAAVVEFENLRARAIRAIMCRHDDDGIAYEVALTRFDVLFAVQP